MAQVRFFAAHVGTEFVLFSVAFNFGNAQADFFAVQIHFNDFSFNNLANFQNVARSFDALRSDFGNVNQTFNFVAQFNDSAESQQTNNFYIQNVADVELRSFNLPGIFQSSFDAQSNTFVFAVDALNQNGYFVAFFSNVSSFYATVPRQFGVVNQTNQTFTDFNEQTEFSNFYNLTETY